MKIKLITIFFTGALLIGCASDPKPPRELTEIKALEAGQSAQNIGKIRLNALKSIARSIGAQGGLAWRAQRVNRVLLRHRSDLNTVFNFNAMLLNHNVLPPVLIEGRHTLNLNDTQTIRLADRTYDILAPARFVTAPPSWRDYLWMNFKKPDIPNQTLLPRNDEERDVWNQYVRKGWDEGVKQADEIFSANIGRLKRDLNGMVLYHNLLAQNMVSAPFVSHADLGVTGNAHKLRVNDRILRITSVSKLQPNSRAWNAVISAKAKKKPRYRLHRSYNGK